MISKSFNPKTRDLTALFPKWSAAYADPNSNLNKLLNPLANVLEYVENTTEDILQDGVIARVDTDKHPYRRWLFDSRDVSGYDTQRYSTSSLYVRDIVSLTGYISGQPILMINCNTEEEFYNPTMQTGWTVATEIPIYASGMPVSGTVGGCEIYNNQLHVLYTEYEGQADPGKIYRAILPSRWLPNIEASNIMQIVDIEPPPIYTTQTEYFDIVEPNTRVILGFQFGSHSEKLTILDITGDEDVIASGITFYDTSTYAVRDTFIGDVDGDGIIDQVDINKMTPHLGKQSSNFSPEEWERTYKKYDINQDGKIDNADLTIVYAVQNSIQSNGSAVLFANTGRYSITYTAPQNNYAAPRSLYTSNGFLDFMQNETHGYLTPYWPVGHVDACYDQDKDLLYFLDNNDKAIFIYELNELGTVYDKLKVQLPLTANLQLRGITYSRYRIYILAFLNEVPHIITLKTDEDDIHNAITTVKIHSGTPTNDPHIFRRDVANLTSSAKGLSIINSTKLVTIHNGNIVILTPLYDYMFRSTDAEGYDRISMREKYESIVPIPSGNISPIFQNLWNMVDTHGEEKGLYRIPGETNESFKNRIMDVFAHFPSRDKQGTLFGIARELGLDLLNIPSQKKIDILPAPINRINASSIEIFEDESLLSNVNIEVEAQYRYGKYSHDKITCRLNDQDLAVIEKDILSDQT